MNPQLFSFSLFLLWLGIAILALVIVPIFFPKMMADSRPLFIGIGAGMLSLWNFVRLWSIRSAIKERRIRQQMEEEYRKRTNPSDDPNKPKPILNPEFQFDDSPSTKIPPPPPPKGTVH